MHCTLFSFLVISLWILFCAAKRRIKEEELPHFLKEHAMDFTVLGLKQIEKRPK